MIRSMTGYASVREQIEDARVTLEIKTLNHKSHDIHFHSPRLFAMLEMPVRERLKERIRRGRVEVSLRVAGSLFAQEMVQPKIEVARQYLQAAWTIATQLGLPFEPRADFLLTQGGVLELEEPEISVDQVWDRLKGLVDQAIHALLAMKENEGARLKIELESILDRMDGMVQQIKSLRGAVLQEYRDKMLARIAEWDQNLELDPGRVLQEVAFYTDRSDIQEETARLDSHIQQFHEILNANGRDSAPYDAIGRRLDFLCQEMFREVNTISSKSSSLEITRLTIELKAATEQLREQVQNVE
mgnify:CR=1 FL=1